MNKEDSIHTCNAYEPRCDSCPSGVANAIRARMTPLQRMNKAAEDNGEEL